jgi:hypothetical protein
VADGYGWDEIGEALGCSGATTPQQVLDDYESDRRWMWRHFGRLTEE